MAQKKKISFDISDLADFFNRYWKLGTFIILVMYASFKAGQTFEGMKKDKEIYNLQNKHLREVFDLKEKYRPIQDRQPVFVINLKDSIYGNEKDK